MLSSNRNVKAELYEHDGQENTVEPDRGSGKLLIPVNDTQTIPTPTRTLRCIEKLGFLGSITPWPVPRYI
jgi:hypothetical protein